MLIQNEKNARIFRTAAIGLLAGCAWLSTAAIASAQDQTAPQQNQRNDAAIQSDVGAMIKQDATLQGQQISASSAQGIVTLTGTVQTDAQRQQAETDAANVAGVAGILNELKVTNPGSAAPAAGIAAQDAANQVSPEGQNQGTSQSQQQSQESVPPPPPDQTQPQQAPAPAYGAPRPPYQPGYAPAPQQVVPYYSTPTAPVTVPVGTLLRVRLSEPLDTDRTKSGDVFQGTVAVDVYQNGVLAIPRGASVTGQVIEAKKGGELGGSAVLALQITTLNLAGKIFPVTTDVWSSKGPNKAGYTAGNTAGGALLGAVIGGIIGHGAGAAIGAGVGAAGGLAASAATSGPRIYLPTEATIDFHLTAPAMVQPVSWQEAQRLASSAPRTPVLVQRPVYVVPPPYYGPYPYAYPYPY